MKGETVKMEPDFSGYATKAGLKCSDGRTITAEAFKHMDGQTIPLVWQHGHSSVENVLGHGILEARPDGMYVKGFFNDTTQGQTTKTLVQHGDVKALSIYANQLVEKLVSGSKQVLHGMIREVSLVLTGANPGALIDFVAIKHSDGEVETLEDEAVITTGLEIEFTHADAGTSSDSPTVQDIFDTMTEEQQNVVSFLVGEVMKEAGIAQSGISTDENTDGDKPEDKSGDKPDDTTEDKPDDKPGDDNKDLEHKEGAGDMTRNVFEQQGGATAVRPTLTHDQLKAIVEDAQKTGSFKEAFLAHAVTYGIENIDLLFPDAKALSSAPELVSRRMEWVSTVIGDTRKSPFARIKTMSADITHDEARAKGYVKGNLKKEEWFGLSRRITTPTTIYKKQKLDRDDIVDITDLDVVAWLKAEMRIMLDEEIARAVLIGDGREIDDEDKIDETHIRPIAYDDDFYNEKVVIAANTTGDALVEAILRSRTKYRGTGQPTLFMVEDLLTDLLLVKDGMGRRLYPTQTDLQAALRVSNIVTVPVMEDLTNDGGDILAVMVNLTDYTLGADRGGAVAMFDDFDIDYNQYKYLIETRLSGALTKFKSAITFSRAAGTLVAAVTSPTFVPTTGVVTIPTVTGVVWKMDGVVKTPGAQTAIPSLSTVEVTAEPDTGFYFHHNIDADWSFTRTT